MRADAHYVEQLDSSMFSAPIRHLDVRTLDPVPKDGREPGPSPAFVESIRRHGVLQPLLVRSRGARFQVVAGAKRLAAAIEVGLGDVPCLVERVDDDEARALAAATNVPSTEPGSAAGPDRPGGELPLAALSECLTAVASSAGLLSAGSTLTHTVALDLVRAETSRALRLLQAVQVLRDEIRPKRKTVAPRAVLERVAESTEPERRLRGLALIINEGDGPRLTGDEALLVASVGALVLAASALLEGAAERQVSLGVRDRADGTVAFVAVHDGAELPRAWRSILADEAWGDSAMPGGTDVTSALMMLRAARHVAEMHGGAMSVDCAEGSTTLSIGLPVR
jgi:ParB-like chromosome segregation protein Spo0J